MADNRTLYLPTNARVDPSELRLLGAGAIVTEHSGGDDESDDAHVTIVWSDVQMTLRVLPAAFAASNRLGLSRYVASQCALVDPGILERLEAREQVLAVTMDPELDPDGRCETVIRGLAELHDAIIRCDDALFDAAGVCLARHLDTDDASAPD